MTLYLVSDEFDVGSGGGSGYRRRPTATLPRPPKDEEDASASDAGDTALAGSERTEEAEDRSSSDGDDAAQKRGAGSSDGNGTSGDDNGGSDDGPPSNLGEINASSEEEERFRIEMMQYLDSMYRLALSLARNPREAEDIAQEATLKALKNWQQYKPGTNMRAWLLAIVRNGFINRYRRQRNRPGSVEFDDVEPFLPDNTTEADDLRFLSVRDMDEMGRIGETLDERLVHALGELSDDFRETFLLAVVEELSYKDIAEILGIPVGTVMPRLFRARRQMAKKLTDYAEEVGISVDESGTPSNSSAANQSDTAAE